MFRHPKCQTEQREKGFLAAKGHVQGSALAQGQHGWYDEPLARSATKHVCATAINTAPERHSIWIQWLQHKIQRAPVSTSP